VTIRRCPAAWLALASMLLNTAWPLLANAKPAVPAPPSEICSATGLKHVAGGAPAAPGKGIHASHCTLCPFGAHCVAAIPRARLLLPSAPVAAPVITRGQAQRPEMAFHAAAPPRAPPSLS
jgi:DUF2946 family protein